MFKKDNPHRSRRGYLVIWVNAIDISKNNKDKNSNKKDLSYIECYIYKQKDYYANKSLKKPKN